jgi:hypothetical protein
MSRFEIRIHAIAANMESTTSMSPRMLACAAPEALLLDKAINQAPNVEANKSKPAAQVQPFTGEQYGCDGEQHGQHADHGRSVRNHGEGETFELDEILDWHADHGCREDPAPLPSDKARAVKKMKGSSPAHPQTRTGTKPSWRRASRSARSCQRRNPFPRGIQPLRERGWE